jgi:hypothetical protein
MSGQLPPVEIPALNLQQITTVIKREAKHTSGVPIILLYILQEEAEVVLTEVLQF